MPAYPRRLVGFDATRGARFRRPVGVTVHVVRALGLALAFEQIGERIPCRRGRIAAVPRRFNHPFQAEVFDAHEVVLTGISLILIGNREEFTLDGLDQTRGLDA